MLVTAVRIYMYCIGTETGKHETSNASNLKRRRSVCLWASLHFLKIRSLARSPVRTFVPFRIVSPYQTSTVRLQVCVILHYWISLFSVSVFFLSLSSYIICSTIALLQWNKLHVMNLLSQNTERIGHGEITSARELQLDYSSVQKYAWSI